MKEEPFYAGSRTQLIDPFNYGISNEVFDAAENKLLYSRGFSTLFQNKQQPKPGLWKKFLRSGNYAFPKE